MLHCNIIALLLQCYCIVIAFQCTLFPHKFSEGWLLWEAPWTRYLMVLWFSSFHSADVGISRSLIKVASSQWNNISSVCCPSVLLMSHSVFLIVYLESVNIQDAKFTFLEVITLQGLSHLNKKGKSHMIHMYNYNLKRIVKISVNTPPCCILTLQYHFSWDFFPVQLSTLSVSALSSEPHKK